MLKSAKLIIAMIAIFQFGVAAADDDAYEGSELYLANCSNCHGVYGEGDGIVTPSLSVVLQDLRYLAERNDGDFPRWFVTEIIDGRELRLAHGPDGMPVWGEAFTRMEGYGAEAQRRVDQKIDVLVDFIESIQISTGEK
jgi:mono/diheme cytochrome c family protein